MLSPTIIVIAAGVLSLLLVFAIGMAVAAAARPKMRLKHRIEALGQLGERNSNLKVRSENRRQKRIQEKVGRLKDTKGKRATLRMSIAQAGLQIDARTYTVISIGLGLASGAVYIVLGMPILGIVPVMIAGGLGLPKLILKMMSNKRQKDFTKSFADAIDVVVRGIRSGLPVAECLKIIGREFPGPVGEEFRNIVEGQNLGLDLDDIMRRGLERMPTSEFNFFAIVLQIQKRTGGNLADTLAGLSSVLRDRKRMKDKVDALSSEAKASAGIIASLPFLVAGMLSILNPDYLSLLFETTTGHVMLFVGGFWGLLGIAVMWKMINFDF